MLPILTAILGAAAGGLAARRRRGNGFDVAQWAGVGAIIGGLAGLLALIVLMRL